ncbi:MAG TPA: hypothetical protein VHE35_14810 [Kofleriaceae bacterium]|nr:hypothetical protein [Kofleriaceae bacterium]
MSIRSRLLAGVATAAAGLTGLALSFGGCRPGEGDRCQRNADCPDPLICNVGTQECQQGVSDNRDSGVDVPLDADEVDAADDAPTDAAPDAPIDAAIDAPP